MSNAGAFSADGFAPSMQAARDRVASIDPVAYAQTRNALEGAVTRLSPYITHGFLSLPDVLRAIHDRHPLLPSHKLVFELAWRAYFQHVWEHEGDGIFESLHEGPLPDGVYASSLPLDIRQARTGVPAIDLAVRILYSTGYLHNHARMWLASYIVHVRRIHWRAGADWLYGHLLDGDLASNHLSWQWVAGTGSNKPYVFNADNVAKFAPVDWHSFNSSIDVSYESMDMIAHGEKTPAVASLLVGVAEPTLHREQPEKLFKRPDPNLVAGRRVHVIHPWSLGDSAGQVCGSDGSETITIAVFPQEATQRLPWSQLRWRFVAQGMATRTPHLWVATASELVQALQGSLSVTGTDNPHLPAEWQPLGLKPAEQLFESPSMRCKSFAKYWKVAAGSFESVDALLAAAS